MRPRDPHPDRAISMLTTSLIPQTINEVFWLSRVDTFPIVYESCFIY